MQSGNVDTYWRLANTTIMKNMIKVTWSFTCVSLPQHTNNLGHSGIEYEEGINDVIDIVVIVEVGKL